MSKLLLTVIVFAALPLSRALPSSEKLESLRFLAGSWAAEGQVVEVWLPPLRGLMVGVNRAPDGDGLPFFEYLRIEARDDGVVYVASPRGSRTTEFRLTEISESHAVFENPAHDFPPENHLQAYRRRSRSRSRRPECGRVELVHSALVEGELSPSLHRHDAVEPVGTVERIVGLARPRAV